MKLVSYFFKYNFNLSLKSINQMCKFIYHAVAFSFARLTMAHTGAYGSCILFSQKLMIFFKTCVSFILNDIVIRNWLNVYYLNFCSHTLTNMIGY